MRTVPVQYVPGGTWGQCMRCAFKIRLNEMKLEWSGLRVCQDCWDPLPDTMTAPVVYPEGLIRPDASPELPNVFVSTPITPGDL